MSDRGGSRTSVSRGEGRSGRSSIRCAIYTRKSSEEGLEQDFNSLHAQREACEAYVLSQRHEGWSALPQRYDDGGFSGGSLQRPAVQRLMSDIEAGLVDCVVVYKVDRLTRSLSDFARMVDVFDERRVSFVSVTQAFNTTNSMGRLTLNVLLSFAQFEREVTGERIRDKIAASKKKGLWMGGWVPLGYDADERTLAINEPEAEVVRTIHRLYLELGNVRFVESELVRRGIRTKRHTSASGKATGGGPFSRGHLYRILANPLYHGMIVHKGVVHKGQHEAIVDDATWNAVQALLATNGHARRVGRNVTEPSLLAGLLVDAHGRAMKPTHAGKAGRRYRYYATGVSDEAPAFRLSAATVEPLVTRALEAALTDEPRVADWIGEGAMLDDLWQGTAHARKLAAGVANGAAHERREAISSAVREIVVGRDTLRFTLDRAAVLGGVAYDGVGEGEDEGVDADPILFETPLSVARKGRGTKLVLSSDTGRGGEGTPDRSLVKALARAHGWWDELSSGRAGSLREIAEREGVTDRYVGQIVRLAFLAPAVTEAILAGTFPDRPDTKTLTLGRDIPLCWEQQRRVLQASITVAHFA